MTDTTLNVRLEAARQRLERLGAVPAWPVGTVGPGRVVLELERLVELEEERAELLERLLAEQAAR